jgi:hypothetical protein
MPLVRRCHAGCSVIEPHCLRGLSVTSQSHDVTNEMIDCQWRKASHGESNVVKGASESLGHYPAAQAPFKRVNLAGHGEDEAVLSYEAVTEWKLSRL